MPIILMLNLKGGVAKTTNAVAISETLAYRGKKVLLIDADHQYTATELLLGEASFLFMEKYKRTLHDLLARMLNSEFDPNTISNFVAPAATNIKEVEDQIECIPCTYRIDEIQTNMAKAKRGFQEPKEFLRKWRRQQRVFQSWCELNYEYTIVDCPPSVALQVKFLLNCADYYISPSVPDRLSVRGTDYLVDRIRSLGYRRIRPLGTLWSMVRVSATTHKDTIQRAKTGSVETATIPAPFETVVPNTEDIAKIMSFEGRFETYKQKYSARVARIYNALCDEIEDRIR